MKLLAGAFMALLSIAVQGQNSIAPEKERLSSVLIGDNPNNVQYKSDEQGLRSPNGPMISETGSLYFVPTYSPETIIFWNSGEWQTKERPNTWPTFISTGYVFASQNGRTTLADTIRYLNWEDENPSQKNWGQEVGSPRFVYPTAFGAILEAPNKKLVLTLEQLAKGRVAIRGSDEARTWLSAQPDGFRIGEDGFLYRNGFLYSARRPTGNLHAERYIGRLISDHTIWAGGGYLGMERFITIGNSAGQTELMLELPWAPLDEHSGYSPFNYGLGPWGELYCLIAPFWDMKSSWPPENSISELVVIRNHLKYFGRLNDSGVRLRKEPSSSAETLGTYPVKTGFRILEKSTKEETIAGQKNFWYKVRLLDGKEGWFFGAFVHNLYDGPNGKAPPWPNLPDR